MSGRNGNGNGGLILSVVCSFMVILLVFSIYSGNGRNFYDNVSSLYGTFSNVFTRFSESSRPQEYGINYTDTNAYVCFSYPVKTHVALGTGNNCGDYVAVFDRSSDNGFTFKALYASKVSHWPSESAWLSSFEFEIKMASGNDALGTGSVRKLDMSDVEIYAITYDPESRSFMLSSKYGICYFSKDVNHAGGR